MLLRLWPLPALLAWGLAWALCLALKAAGVPAALGLLLPALLGALLAVLPPMANTPWRRIFVAAGFPLSVLALGQGGALPAWLWLAPMALLLLAYPVHAWRDAPVFPTPKNALVDLPALLPLPAQARVLDAGCGMGDGLAELHRAYPEATLHGTEWSWLWRLVCAWRCPWATVRRGDMWADDWSGYDLVYLFQRPETMPRAVAKARQELRPGAWLVSLEFEAVDDAGRRLQPAARLTLEGGRPVWLYRQPL